MITKEQILDSISDTKRNIIKKELIEKIEEYIDKFLLKELSIGKRIIKISTGALIGDNFHKSNFYPLWCSDDISKEDLQDVRSIIKEKYSKYFEVSVFDYNELNGKVFQTVSFKLKEEMEEDSKNDK